jgi:haloalkane dehalogenase
MPIELLGKDQNVRVIRPATAQETATEDARRKTAGFRELYPFRPHFLDVGGEQLHYVDEGPRDAAPVLCVHGNPTWSFYYRDLIQALRGARRVVAPDHIGMGLSTKPLDWIYTLESHIVALEALVLELDLTDITLVVHDWGGPIGLGVAARHPERFAKLVIMNTAVWPEGPLPLALRLPKLPFVGALLVRALGAFDRLLPYVAARTKLPADVRRGYAAPYQGYGERVAVQRFVQDIPTGPGHPSHGTLAAVDAALPNFKDRPALILWGAQDWIFTPAFLRLWRARLPEAEVHTIEHAGHLVLEDAPGECIARVRAFLLGEGA